MTAHVLVPLTQAPGGKFVILLRGGKFHYVSAPLSTHPYHAHIVFAFLQEGGRGEAVLTDAAHCRILSPEWEVLGGGYYEVDASDRIFRLSGKSTAYGKYPAEAVRKNIGSWLEDLGLPDFQPVLA